MSQSQRFTSRNPRRALMFVALLLVALNLRLAITSASSLMTALTASGALTPVTVVIIPALPTAVFAVAGVSTARLAERLGRERIVTVGMIVLITGLLLRAIPSPWIIVLGTVIATAGLAVVNILLPAVVRAHFSRRIGPVTIAYTTVMSLGSALAASAAVPIAVDFTVPSLGLATWAAPAIIGLVAWVWFMPTQRPQVQRTATGSIRQIVRVPLPAGTGLLAAYFALQALLSYVIMGWLPSIAADAGLSAERSGLLLGVAMVVGMPATVVVISLGRGIRRMRVGFVLIACAAVTALAGLWLIPEVLPELWAVLLGVGMSAFPLVLALIAGFADNAIESARVSTVVQSLGYSLATVGPLGAGAIRQTTGSWDVVLVTLIVLAVMQGTIGILITRVVARKRAE